MCYGKTTLIRIEVLGKKNDLTWLMRPLLASPASLHIVAPFAPHTSATLALFPLVKHPKLLTALVAVPSLLGMLLLPVLPLVDSYLTFPQQPHCYFLRDVLPG